VKQAPGSRTAPPLLLAGGVIADGEELFLSDGGLLIREGKIAAVGPSGQVRAQARRLAGCETLELKGRLVLPGLLNPHHHLYSSLAVGLAPREPAGTFLQLLESHWWRLDSALDEESIAASALVGVVESVKNGVTMIFDHHASMGCVRGSLRLVEGAFRQAGIKGLLCFEASGRGGQERIEEHFAENLDFWKGRKEGDTVKAAFGLHAGLTLSDRSLARAAELKPEAMPIHVHCGEDEADLRAALQLGYQGPVHRLRAFGLLSRDSLLAHALHLSEQDYRLIEELKPIVVSAPESNANNRVGRMDRSRIRRYLLGTDGMTGDLLLTLRSQLLLGEGRHESLPGLGEAFFAYKREVQQRFFPDTGSLKPGFRADLVVLDYVPRTPIHPGNLLAHLIFGAGRGPAHLTMADGLILYREGRIAFLDEEELNQRAAEAAAKLKERYDA